MTTQIDALKLALEALRMPIKFWNKTQYIKVQEAIEAAEKALAQPEKEPVAWLHWLHGPVRLFLNKDEAMLELDRLNREYPMDKDARQMKPLYTTPPQRKPLTNNGYHCVICGRFLLADEYGVILHDDIEHSPEMTFDDEENPQ